MWPDPPLRERGLRLARRLIDDPVEAEDILQEALLRAWRNRETLRSREKAWPWLAQIISNEAHRARARPAPVLSAGDYEAADEDRGLEEVIARSDFTRLLELLHPQERLVLRLRFEHDLTPKAIGAHLGLAEATVRVRVHRALARLRAAVT